MTNEELKAALFGTGIWKISPSVLARMLHVHPNTIYYWRKSPLTMDFGKVLQIVEAAGFTDDEVLRLFGRGNA